MYPGMCLHGEAFTGWCLGVDGVGGARGVCAVHVRIALALPAPSRALGAPSSFMACRRPRFPRGTFAARWVALGRPDMIEMGLGAYVAQGLLDSHPTKTPHTSTSAGQASYLG